LPTFFERAGEPGLGQGLNVRPRWTFFDHQQHDKADHEANQRRQVNDPHPPPLKIRRQLGKQSLAKIKFHALNVAQLGV
jgi:hypothetical protein